MAEGVGSWLFFRRESEDPGSRSRKFGQQTPKPCFEVILDFTTKPQVVFRKEENRKSHRLLMFQTPDVQNL